MCASPRPRRLASPHHWFFTSFARRDNSLFLRSPSTAACLLRAAGSQSLREPALHAVIAEARELVRLPVSIVALVQLPGERECEQT